MSLSSIFLNPPPPSPSFLHLHSPNHHHPPKPLQIRAKTNPTLQFLKPYLLSQHKPILCGWLCSAVSVYSLSALLSKLPKLPILSATAADAAPIAALLLVARLAAGYAQRALLWEAALGAVYDLRLHVFDRVLHRELAYFEGVSAGDLAYRITAEASDLAVTLYTLLNTIVPSTLQLSAMMMQMLVISPTLSLISAMIVPCMVLVVTFLGQELRKISKEAHVSIAALSAYLNEVLPAILFVKANNAQSCENTRFKRLALMDYNARLKKKKMKALIPQPIQDVGKAYNEWRQGEPAAERLLAMTRFKNKVVEKPDAADLDRVTGDLKFCDVSFGYNDDMALVLNALNLHIKSGEIVAIVGPSGGGKTTLVKLLLRLYDPISGCILIDNHNIQNIRLASLRRHVSVVSQDITLFSGTVAENIGYRDLTTKIDMDRVKHAAQTAHADEFIKKLPEGYKTNIGPRGSTLSGGQRQRLAIARAFYQNSSILILDEATSSLDSKSELLVRQAVERLMQNRTVLVISHRLETVMMAKRVFLLDNGKLKELPQSTLLDGHHKDSLLSSGLVI
ncbi:ABC transporter B family member 29, chloroplastic isoform X2 [Glycine max]|uniref:ABC transporter B family member 29, chloroplastic isoform X2 n=1 Tax=Glycine max TaxID=3847 RepID=UPI0003DEA712|nr:ABC transporter B family member 29, chloroplastic isoform X2 [Glycine max]|eukprot:XP_006588845.1 ABC transporter B family member 29, chloroplastic isoform X2 [Glycine max]